jgi:DNA invertase Pin-like site-specific DNA recombinase
MHAAIYVRVSTSSKTEGVYDQDPAMQVEPLQKFVADRGWSLFMIYADRASGSGTARPALQRLMKDAKKRLFDVVVVWKFDRFARSLAQLVSALDEFSALGIDFVSHQESVDTSVPVGKLMFHLIAAMAEFERALIRERVMAGLEHAKANGTRSGQPIGRPRAVFPRGKIAELMQAGVSLRRAARMLGIGYGTARKDLIENPVPGQVELVVAGKGSGWPGDSV